MRIAKGSTEGTEEAKARSRESRTAVLHIGHFVALGSWVCVCVPSSTNSRDAGRGSGDNEHGSQGFGMLVRRS